MSLRTWVVGHNEIAVLGEGWYDRSPEWFGLPYRESFPRATLRVPVLGVGDRLTLLLSSNLGLRRGEQQTSLRVGENKLEFTLKPQLHGICWQTVSLDIRSSVSKEKERILAIESEGWRHGDIEEVPDFREVGVLLAAVFLRSPKRGA